MKLKELIAPNQSDVKATEMTYPDMYKPIKRTTPTRQMVVYRDTKTGKVYGRRTIFQ